MLAVPVAIGACGLLLAAHTYTLKQKLDMPVELASQDPAEKLAFQGTFGHISQRPWTDTRGRFRSVEVTTDALGADIFLVDYGNGCLVTQYHDPRILL